MKKYFLFMWLCCTLVLTTKMSLLAQAPQRICVTMEKDAALRAKYPQLGTLDDFEKKLKLAIEERKKQKAQGRIVDGVYEIPVVVFVIHNGEAVGTGRNISYNRILDQINVLNQDYRRKVGTPGFNTDPRGADTKIEFVLARRRPDGSAFPSEDGVVRINRTSIPGLSAPPHADTDVESIIKPYTTVTLGYDGSKYMSFWSVDISGGILGYAQFPVTTLGGMDCNPGSTTTDGVVMGYTTVGGPTYPGTAPYGLGRTATHEIGHWLGLRHIWGDASCGDDFCTDTPKHQSANFGCPSHPRIRCGEDEMFENYMDYTDDNCMNIFTKDQTTRMRTILETSRWSLINSDAAVPPATSDAGVVQIISPVYDLCSGTTTPVVRIRNLGSTTLTSVTVEYQIDGGAVNTKAFTGLNIASGAFTNLTLDPVTGIAVGNHIISARTTLPNGVTDPNPSGDTSNAPFTRSNGLLPLTETFEGTFLPTYWGRENTNDDCVTWTNSQATGLVGPVAGSLTSAQLRLFLDATAGAKDDALILPTIDLTTSNANAKLDFYVAYRRKNTSSVDRLRVQISTDCGVTWSTTPYDKAGTTLATVADGTAEFTPAATGNWRLESVSLSAYVGSVIKVRLLGTSTGNNNGNNIWIDNVRAYDDRPTINFVSATSTTTETNTSTVGCRNYTDFNIPMTITATPSSNTTIGITVDAASTALSPLDYQLMTPSLTFNAGSAANQNITVRVFDNNSIQTARLLVLNAAIIFGNGALLGGTLSNRPYSQHTLTINDNDVDVMPVNSVILWSENFESITEGEVTNTTVGTNWAKADRTPGNNKWVIGANAGLSGSKAAYISNNVTTRPLDYTNTSISRTRLISPKLVTTGYTNLKLSFNFKSNGEALTTTVYDYGRLMYSLNGTTFTAITGPADGTSNGNRTNAAPFFEKTTTTSYTVNLPVACENQATLYIVWRWDNDDTDGVAPPFAIDDIVLTTQLALPVETVANSQTIDFGPNAVVYVKNSGKIVAKLKNNTAHDYGCTTVAINRTGNSATELWNTGVANHATNKTLLITPTTDNPAGSYEITMYYDATEVTGWETGTSKTYSSVAKIIRSGDAIANITSAAPLANGNTNVIAYNTVNAIYDGTKRRSTATFTNSLGGGFAVGDPGNRIVLGAVSTNLCQGEIVSIPYTVVAPFNTGNTFTAKLSNNSFASSTAISAVTNGTGSGSLSSTIPVITGANYRIRVEADVPVTNSNDNGTNITIGACGACAAPSSVNFAQTTINNYAALNVTWSSATGVSTGALKYQLRYKRSAGTEWIYWNTDATSYTMAGLNPNTQYDFEIATFCATGGVSAIWSPLYQTTTGAAPNTCPTATLGASTPFSAPNNVVGANLTWTGGAPVAGRRFFLSYVKNGETSRVWRWIDTNGVTVRSDLDYPNLLPSSTYTYDLFVFCNLYYFSETAIGSPGTFTTGAVSMADREVDTSVSTQSIVNDLIVYPNPSEEDVYISYPTTKNNAVALTVIDVLGRTVYSQDFSGSVSVKLDGKTLRSGVYVAKVTENGKVMTKRFVVK